MRQDTNMLPDAGQRWLSLCLAGMPTKLLQPRPPQAAECCTMQALQESVGALYSLLVVLFFNYRRGLDRNYTPLQHWFLPALFAILLRLEFTRNKEQWKYQGLACVLRMSLFASYQPARSLQASIRLHHRRRRLCHVTLLALAKGPALPFAQQRPPATWSALHELELYICQPAAAVP